MIRILFFQHVSSIGGASWCLLELIRELDRSSYEPIVVLRQPGPLENELTRIGVQCIHLSRFGQISQTYQKCFPFYRSLFLIELIRFIPAYLAAKRIIRKISPDLVYLNTSVFLPIAVAARHACNARVIMHIREHWDCGLFSMRRILKNHIARSCVDQFFAITQTNADCFGFPERTRIVHDWPDLDSRGESADVQKELGLDNSARIFLVPGGNLSIKGTHIAIKAFSMVERDDTALVILGMNYDGLTGWKQTLYNLLRPFGVREQGEELRRQALLNRDGKIKYCSPVKDIKSYLEASVAVLSPFVVPHAAKAALEAGSLRRVAIVSDNGEGREYVKHCETGLVVPAGDAKALAAAMRQVLEDPGLCARLGNNAQRYVSEQFNKTKSMDVVISSIKELI